jgi:hypothetical protein
LDWEWEAEPHFHRRAAILQDYCVLCGVCVVVQVPDDRAEESPAVLVPVVAQPGDELVLVVAEGCAVAVVANQLVLGDLGYKVTKGTALLIQALGNFLVLSGPSECIAHGLKHGLVVIFAIDLGSLVGFEGGMADESKEDVGVISAFSD